jgi:hypothetical protein
MGTNFDSSAGKKSSIISAQDSTHSTSFSIPDIKENQVRV